MKSPQLACLFDDDLTYQLAVHHCHVHSFNCGGAITSLFRTRLSFRGSAGQPTRRTTSTFQGSFASARRYHRPSISLN
jgi:hypothetical protein